LNRRSPTSAPTDSARRHWALAFLTLTLLLAPTVGRAQLEPPSTGGAATLARERRMLGHYERVLMIGAHPDDEDTELLTLVTRQMGAEAAYLSLNRGEGGQNLIGSELGPALGLLRTEELLAARRLDGAHQFFTRAYDFGFSKTLDETWKHWPRDTILKDVVRVIRRFRPQIVVSVFSGTPRDGHGQHQAAGWAAQEAFRIAGDSTRFPELEREEGLRAWRPLKLYRSARFDTSATTLTLEGGALDPTAGKSYHQIAMESRSRHRSQDMGRLQELGPSPVRLSLIADSTGHGRGGLFAGVDTSLAAMDFGRGEDRSAATDGAASDWASVARQLATLPAEPAPGRATLAVLVGARAAFEALLPVVRRGDSAVRQASIEQRDQLDHLDRAAAAASGVVLDATADDDEVVDGQPLHVTVSVWNTTADTVRISADVGGAGEWTVSPGGFGHRLFPGQLLHEQLTATVAGAVTAPYFTLDQPEPAIYRWHAASPATLGLPFAPPPLTVRLRVSGDTDQRDFYATREVTYRTRDEASGEVRLPITVIPRVDVKLEPATALWVAGGSAPHTVTVVLTHGARDTTEGRLRLEVPAGWTAPAPRNFRFTREGESESYSFEVKPPAGVRDGSFALRAVAGDAGGHRYAEGVVTVDYPHIRPEPYTVAAETRVRIAPLALPPLKAVGYVRGAADRVPEALRSVGVPVELLDARTLARGDLSRYDAIVIGPRAYETDSALVEHNGRLLDYARAGGLLLVQYQQYQFVRGGFAPYPFTIASPHDRVTEEDAPVRTLRDDRLLHAPNEIGAADWRGWVQERGLYFAHSWDPHYRTLLEMHDTGEPPKEGGLLIAPLGRGTYVYTGLAFFRELPAAVPGAYRLFVNLLALRGQHP
jgi:LmbE family N-acetylglucosaminyl deacetylase